MTPAPIAERLRRFPACEAKVSAFLQGVIKKFVDWLCKILVTESADSLLAKFIFGKNFTLIEFVMKY